MRGHRLAPGLRFRAHGDERITRAWQRIMSPGQRVWVGSVAGAALDPFELVLTALLRERPTPERMICGKGRGCVQS